MSGFPIIGAITARVLLNLASAFLSKSFFHRFWWSRQIFVCHGGHRWRKLPAISEHAYQGITLSEWHVSIWKWQAIFVHNYRRNAHETSILHNPRHYHLFSLLEWRKYSSISTYANPRKERHSAPITLHVPHIWCAYHIAHKWQVTASFYDLLISRAWRPYQCNCRSMLLVPSSLKQRHDRVPGVDKLSILSLMHFVSHI